MNCPNCKNSDYAEILWGYPVDMKQIEKEIDKGKIILGGCVITNHDPKWECNKCHHRWGHREDDEVDSDNTSSFDFELGFNLDEVYDR